MNRWAGGYKSQGIDGRVTAGGVTLTVGERHPAGRIISVGPTGEIVAEASVAGEDQNDAD